MVERREINKGSSWEDHFDEEIVKIFKKCPCPITRIDNDPGISPDANLGLSKDSLNECKLLFTSSDLLPIVCLHRI